MVGKSSTRRKANKENMVREGAASSNRARRFPLRIPVRYRLPSSRGWLEASTENVSCSGILFRADYSFKPTTTLDLRLELPRIGSADKVHGEVVCKGEVVRVESAQPFGIPPAVAVAIHYYRLEQKREPN